MNDFRCGIEKYSSILMLFYMQQRNMKHDSKCFVDRPYKRNIDEITESFERLYVDIVEKVKGSSHDDYKNVNLPKILCTISLYNLSLMIQNIFESIEESDIILQKDITAKTDLFIKDNFEEKAEDFEGAEIPDKVNDELDFGVTDESVKEVAKDIQKLWGAYYKKIKDNKEAENTTLIHLPHPFTIPGGRFREIYYWDSYWIMDGQLVCEMYETVHSSLRNFVHLINTYGFIPNGTRKYYLKRSQPPLIIQMVYNFYCKSTQKVKSDFLTDEILDVMEKEYRFWMTQRLKTFTYDNREYHMNFYNVESDYPRPESLKEDIRTVREFINTKDSKYDLDFIAKIDNMFKHGIGNIDSPYIKDENNVYGHIKAAAESGWDFSTRFFKDGKNMHSICTNEIIPVDLNSIMYENEVILSKFFKIHGNEQKGNEYAEKAKKRMNDINDVLWKDDCWYDYNYHEKQHNKTNFYFSNIMPMVSGILPEKRVIYKILYKYRKELFGYIGGIPVSAECESAQQWDYPNVWAPLQSYMVKFLLDIKEREMALHVAQSFYRSVVGVHKGDEKIFYEKYNCDKLGVPGGNGEYEVQTGFGWTNGVIIRFIEIFGDKIKSGIDEHGVSYNKISRILSDEIEAQDEEITKQTIDDITSQPLENVELCIIATQNQEVEK